MAVSGELAKFHEKCSALEDSVAGGYLKVVDQLDRSLQQINETEDDIYDSLRDSKDLERLRFHSDPQYKVLDSLSLSSGNRSVENLAIVQGCDGAAVEAETLLQLVGARALIMMAKAQVADEYATRIAKEDAAAAADVREYVKLRDSLVAAYGDDFDNLAGDAKIFQEQVE